MRGFFFEKVVVNCNLSGYSLEELFTDWKSNEFILNKTIEPHRVILGLKYIRGIGGMKISTQYNKAKQQLEMTIEPLYKAYFTLAIVPFFYVCIFCMDKNISIVYWLMPLVFLIIQLYAMRYGVMASTRSFLVELKLLLKKNSISYKGCSY